MRLGMQFLIGLSAIAITVGLVAGTIIRQTERSYLYTYIVDDRTGTFDLLVSSLLDDVISEDLPRIETTMQHFVQRDSKLTGVLILTEMGSVLYSWHRSDRKYASLEDFDTRHVDEDLKFSRDIIFEGETFGKMVMLWDTSVVEGKLDRHTYFIAFGVGGICLVLGLLVYFVADIFAIRPINRIAARLARFRGGDYAPMASLPDFASWELHRLTDSVNDLGRFMHTKEAVELELRSERDAATKANQAKSDFLANMSHELRTPLNAINGFSEMMCMEMFGPLGDSHYQDYAQKINYSGTLLLSLINDVLDLAKIESGKMDLETQDFELFAAVETAVNLVRPQARENEIELVMELTAENKTLLRADERRIHQILLNLLSNGVKYTPPGGSVSINVLPEADGAIALIITDTGIGIDPERLEAAFEPFSRLESAYSRNFEGTGLGLPLTKAMIELHKGYLRVSSNLGEGTQAIVVLPPDCVIRDADAGDQSQAPNGPASPGETTGETTGATAAAAEPGPAAEAPPRRVVGL